MNNSYDKVFNGTGPFTVIVKCISKEAQHILTNIICWQAPEDSTAKVRLSLKLLAARVPLVNQNQN